jgi:starch synthase
MEILFLSTELAPFVKVGGLADVAAALPKALRALGHKVTIVAPRFAAFEAGGLLMARRLTPLRLPLGDRTVEVTVFDGRLASQVDLTLVDAPGMFDRPGVYGDGAEDYTDNATRFAVLSRAAAEIARQRAAAGSPFDIVQCNDWPAALVPSYLREMTAQTPALGATKTVLTIHNVAHQGVFPKEVLPETGLGWEAFTIDGLEFYGGINLLKQGIVTADAVTTVSATYAAEIQTPEGGHKLDGVLRRRGPITGIVNGVDYSVWNPATDPAIAARYDAEDLSNKARCRGALQREVGLPLDPNAPLVVCVGRITPQKGSDVLARTLPQLLRATDAQVIVAGDGDPAIVHAIEHAVGRSHGRAVFARAAPEPLVHRIFAGGDIALVPSRYEPCGLVQMYAQRYGTLPVAHATGGLVDTIVDCDAKLETGSGFLFQGVTEEALLGATERAIAARTLAAWPRLVRRVMLADRGWDRPARRYDQLFRSLR